MRPEDFSPPETTTIHAWSQSKQGCFNEAGGFLPRKLQSFVGGQAQGLSLQ